MSKTHTDGGYVIMDENNNFYNLADKNFGQLRNAKIYHSKLYAEKMLQEITKKYHILAKLITVTITTADTDC